MSTFLIFQCMCIFVIIAVTEPARILLLPFAWKSHVFEISSIGHELLERGHEVHIILPPSYPDFQKLNTSSPLHVMDYEVKEPDFHTMYATQPSVIDNLIETLMKLTPVENIRMNFKGYAEACMNFLSDTVMFSRLKDLNFDLAIVDVFPFSRCQLAVPYRLGIPYISLTTTYEPWLFRAPALPSFVPFPLAQYFTEKMTFIQRLQNGYQLFEWSFSTNLPFLSNAFMRQYITDKPYRSLNQLVADSKLWLFDTDEIIDYPRPMMPNEINIGGLATKPAKPLPDDLQQVMDKATEGAIIMCFGSFDILSVTILQRFFKTFQQLPQTIVIRSEMFNDQIQVPKNVIIVKWLPQNDILGHKNTRLFITHCGTNSQFEALYHGVPMLGFPVFGDQPYNARRMEYHGFGRHLNLLHFTSETLLRTINSILNNQTYYDNISRASRIFRSQPLTANKRASYWVERVLDFGMDHLRSHALDMEWYEYLMLDILALMFGVIFIMILVCCGVICHCVHKSNSSSNQKSKQE